MESKDWEIPTVPFDDEGFVKSFDITADSIDEVRDFFGTYGFVVIRDVIEQELVAEIEDDIWSLVENLSQKRFSRDDPKSWIENEKVWLGLYGSSYNAKKGFIGMVSLQNSAFKVRQHPNVYALYRALYGREEMHAKWDRFNFMRPTKGIKVGDTLVDRPDWKTEPFIHWDQNPWDEPEFCRIQGVLAISEHNSTSGGFHCVPGFPPHFKEWAELNKSKRDVGSLIDMNEPKTEAKAVRITMRKGSICCWDSRTPHGNWPNDNDKPRMVLYTALFPIPHDEKYEMRMEAREAEIKHYLKMRSKMTELKNPHDPVELTDLGKKIHGLKRWYEKGETDEGKQEQAPAAHGGVVDLHARFQSQQCGM